jgi:LysM repeat protein
MLLKRILVAVLPLLAVKGLVAQNNSDVIDYINTYKELAISEMQRSGVPASITLAQGIHETMAGKSPLVLKSRNHFGIKCKSTWVGDKVYHDDDARGECFRSYTNAAESYADHSDFLRKNGRYSFLFDYDPTDYDKWAWGLKKAGYATNNRYPQILIKYIEDYNLQQYTLIAMGKIQPKDEILAGNGKPVSDMAITNGVAIREIPAIAPPKPIMSYPAGEFKVNETRVTFAKAGTSLLSIAEQYNISLKRLIDFNDMQEEDVLKQDQLIFLQRKRKTGAAEFHVVQAGETMYDICQAEGIRMESLMAYNHLQDQPAPAIGEKLYLHTKAPARPRLAQEVVAVATPVKQETNYEQITTANSSAISATTHIVRGKETLYSIARKYGTTVEQVREWNKLAGYELKAGQELVIYKN